MADEMAKLQVWIDANTQRFDRGMRRTTQNFNRNANSIERRAGRLEQRVSTAFAGIGKSVLAVSAAAVSLGTIDRALAKLDRIGKVASSTGFSTDEVQELRLGAELSGASIEALDKSLEGFSRRVAEARTGMGEALPVLKALGIEFNNQDGTLKSNRDLFGEVADAIKSIDNPADQLLVAYKLLGRSGAVLVNMLRNGEKGLRKVAKEAHDMGVVVGEDAVRATERLNDRFTKLAAGLSGRHAQSNRRSHQGF